MIMECFVADLRDCSWCMVLEVSQAVAKYNT